MAFSYKLDNLYVSNKKKWKLEKLCNLIQIGLYEWSTQVKLMASGSNTQ